MRTQNTKKGMKERDMKTIKKGFSFAVAVVIISPGLVLFFLLSTVCTYTMSSKEHVYTGKKKDLGETRFPHRTSVELPLPFLLSNSNLYSLRASMLLFLYCIHSDVEGAG